MEWIIERMCDGGIKRPKHVRTATLVRGRVSVELERDDRRHRQSLVARVQGSMVGKEIQPLYDVQLLSNDGGSWRLVGYEYQVGGHMARDQIVGQTWSLTPAVDEDLNAAERRVEQLLRELSAARGGLVRRQLIDHRTTLRHLP